MSTSNGTVSTTSARFRDFDAEQAEVEGDPITFKLGGFMLTCVQPPPVGGLIVMGKYLDKDPAAQMAGAYRMLESWIIPEQHEDLEKALMKVSDPDFMEKLLEFLVEAATGRPTSAP